MRFYIANRKFILTLGLAVLIILIGIYSLTVGYTRNNHTDSIENNKISDACKEFKVYPENKIYEIIGVPECCFALALTVQAEGYYSGSVPPECSGKEMDKIYEFCEKNNSCWE